MYFRTKTQGCSRSIHCHVSAADNSDFFAVSDRGIVVLAVCFHQVVSGQIFICREYAVCLFSRDSHEHRKTCAGTDEDSLKAFLLHQFVDGHGFSDDDIGFDFYAERFYVLDLFCNDFILRKTELRNSVAQNTAGFVQRFKDGYVIAQTCQIAGTGKACRTGTDDSDFVSVLFRGSSRFDPVLFRPVRNETLQFSDGNRVTFDTADTFSFALAFLRADTSADCRKGAGLSDDLISFFDVSFFYLGDESRDINVYRAAGDTFCIFTIQAAGSLFHRLFFIISETYLVKICRTYLWILLTDRYSC